MPEGVARGLGQNRDFFFLGVAALQRRAESVLPAARSVYWFRVLDTRWTRLSIFQIKLLNMLLYLQL
jgi:hypothetical protein